MVRETTRRFICKRCGKPSTDKMGGFSRWDSKNQVEIIYENIDLCNPCFKRTRKEQSQIGMLQQLMQKGILKTEEDFIKFQEDKQFRNKLIQENFVAKSGDLKAKNKAYIEELRKKSNEVTKNV